MTVSDGLPSPQIQVTVPVEPAGKVQPKLSVACGTNVVDVGVCTQVTVALMVLHVGQGTSQGGITIVLQ